MAESRAVNTIGISVYFVIDDELRELTEVKSIPELGMIPSKLETTHLKCRSRTYENGVSDNSGEIAFTCNAVPSGLDGSNIDLIDSMDPETSYRCIVKMPKVRKQCVYYCKVSGRYSAISVDAIQEFIVATTPTGDLTFPALSESYGVTYMGNAPDGLEATGEVSDTMSYEVGTSATVKANAFAVEGYTFIGWSDSATGLGKTYDEGDKIVMTEDVVLYAQWLKDGE